MQLAEPTTRSNSWIPQSLWNQKEEWYKFLDDHEYIVTHRKSSVISDWVLARSLPQFEMRFSEKGQIGFNVGAEALAARYSFNETEKIGVMELFPFFKCDGSSGPTIDTESTILPAFNHDAFYRFARLYCLHTEYRKPVDDLYRLQLIQEGAWRIRAFWHWRGVRRFAEYAWTAEPRGWDDLYVVESLD